MHTSRFRSPLVTSFAVPLLGSLGSTVAALGCLAEPAGSEDEQPGSADSALTAGQCDYFDVNGKVQICHHTGSAKHPYTIIKTSVQGCINDHSAHAGDYIAVNDPTCQGGGCLPVNAPCDATLPCCDGSTCENGTCQVIDPCAAAPCQNGGTCTANGADYTCACAPGWTGTNCDTCVPTTCAAQGASCGTIPDGCGGTLTCGGSCESACPCDALPSWQNALAGTLVTTGPCLNYSFPGPCGSEPDHSWAFSQNGGTLARIIGGDQGGTTFCGVQVHDPNTCGGQGIDFLEVTPAQAVACRAEVVSFGTSQGGACN